MTWALLHCVQSVYCVLSDILQLEGKCFHQQERIEELEVEQERRAEEALQQEREKIEQAS